MKQTMTQNWKEASQITAMICQLPEPVKDRIRYMIDGATLVSSAHKAAGADPHDKQAG